MKECSEKRSNARLPNYSAVKEHGTATQRHADFLANRDHFRPHHALVEVSGLEPLTPCLQSRCSTKLSYTPAASDGWWA